MRTSAMEEVFSMLTHVWGLLAHPNREWKQIHDERETIITSTVTMFW